MVNVCCVPMCGTYGRKRNGITMFRFPKDKKMQKIWIQKLRLDTRKSKRNPVPFTIKKNTKVCSKHFIREVFGSEAKRLKLNAIPSIFPWTNNEKNVREEGLTKRNSCIDSMSPSDLPSAFASKIDNHRGHEQICTHVDTEVQNDSSNASLNIEGELYIPTAPLDKGSISDKEIIKQSGFVECIKSKVQEGFLQPGDTFLADKGFQIQDLLEVHKININIPVFKISGVQFSPEDVQHIHLIAHERIHVERAFSRIKHYRILSQTVDVSYLGTMNQIWTVRLFVVFYQIFETLLLDYSDFRVVFCNLYLLHNIVERYFTFTIGIKLYTTSKYITFFLYYVH